MLCGYSCIMYPMLCGYSCIMYPMLCGYSCIKYPMLCGYSCIMCPMLCGYSCKVSYVVWILLYNVSYVVWILLYNVSYLILTSLVSNISLHHCRTNTSLAYSPRSFFILFINTTSRILKPVLYIVLVCQNCRRVGGSVNFRFPGFFYFCKFVIFDNNKHSFLNNS